MSTNDKNHQQFIVKNFPKIIPNGSKWSGSSRNVICDWLFHSQSTSKSQKESPFITIKIHKIQLSPVHDPSDKKFHIVDKHLMKIPVINIKSNSNSIKSDQNPSKSHRNSHCNQSYTTLTTRDIPLNFISHVCFLLLWFILLWDNDLEWWNLVFHIPLKVPVKHKKKIPWKSDEIPSENPI